MNRIREKVVVFDGENDFIIRKQASFDKNEGKAVSVDGSVSTPEGIAFKEYMDKEGKPIDIPNLSQPDFCARALDFINTRGNGKATAEMVHNTYQLYQANCIEKPPTDNPLPAVPLEQVPVVEAEGLPAWDTLDCETLAKEIAKAEKTDTTGYDFAKRRAYSVSLSSAKALQYSKCINPSPVSAPVPVVAPQTLISMDDSTFGTPPSSGGGDSQTADKKNNSTIWLLLGAVVIIYIITKK